MFFKNNVDGDLYPYGFWERLKSPWKELLAFGLAMVLVAALTIFPIEVYRQFTAEQRERESANLQAFVDRYDCVTVLVGRFPIGRFAGVDRTTTMRCAKLGPDSIRYGEIFERAQAEGVAGR